MAATTGTAPDQRPRWRPGRFRPASWLAWGIAGATLAAEASLVWPLLEARDRLPDRVADVLAVHAGSIPVTAAFPVVGAVIVARHPRHVIGWLMSGLGAAAIADTLVRWYALGGLYLRGGLPGPEYAAWAASWSWFPTIMVGLVYVPLLFPHGRLPGPRWRPVAVAAGAWIGLTTAGLALLPGPLEDFRDVDSPVSVPAAVGLAVLVLLTPVAVGAGLAAVLMQRRRAVGDEREQLRWLLYALAVAVVGWAAGVFVDWGPLAAVLTLGPLTLLPVAIGVAIIKYRLYDIDVIINRTLVYGGLTAAVLAAYGLVVVALSVALPGAPEWRWSVLVVAAVAIVAYPLREWLQRAVNRLTYGDRDHPGIAMSRLARRVADTLTPAALLPAAAETIGQALRLPYVAVALDGTRDQSVDRPVAAYGTPRGEPYRIGLVHQGEPVGTLLLGHRGGSEQFTPADLRVLDDVARQLAVAAHAVRLTEDLQRSRERLVLAREEERRRLWRDLHDGLGSALAGLVLHAGNARRALPGDPEAATGWAVRLEDGIGAAMGEVRRIVEDLRPSSLDELGLVGALRRQAESLPVRVTVEAPPELPPLPAAVEVAAYRIAVEALVNAARHSQADRATVQVDLCDGSLRVQVSDPGIGLPARPRRGVGLQSMRERAAELGGECTAGQGPGGGTMVQAVLPLPGA